MATSSSPQSEDQFLCSICLDVFTKPVTTLCGHNFCMACISGYWDNTDHCLCPLCKQRFDRRPDLFVNTFIADMAEQFRNAVQEKSPVSQAQRPTKPGEMRGGLKGSFGGWSRKSQGYRGDALSWRSSQTLKITSTFSRALHPSAVFLPPWTGLRSVFTLSCV
uniref:RING-type domain-containing protein n=1 Tax=Hucho hucho TaxID=62062 RepID=A0A4W5RA65_9TELE